LKPNKILLKTFFDILDEEGLSSLPKLNIYLRMHLTELTNDFMRTFEDFFNIYEKDNISRLLLVKRNPSIFEIFSPKRFSEYLNMAEVNPYFNLKYMKDKKKMVDLYSKFMETKCFNNYLKVML
jgi:hypothetical protein